MKFRLTSPYGELTEVRDHVHHGVDFAMPEGTTLRTITDGVIEKVVDYGNADLGKGVFLRNEDGTLSIYGHLNEVKVKVGEHLNAGDVVGLSGNTGHSTGPHLHFGMKAPDGSWLDPTPIAEKVAEASGNGGGFANWFLERGKVGTYENADISLIDRFFDAFSEGLYASFVDIAHGLTNVMPEIGGFLTIAAGILIMVTRNSGKWLGWWSVSMTGVIVWLINANS